MCQHLDENVMKCNLRSEAQWNELLKITEVIPGYNIITHVCLDPAEHPHCVMLEAYENETSPTISLESAMKHGHMFLENGDWDSASAYFGCVLDIIRLRT